MKYIIYFDGASSPHTGMSAGWGHVVMSEKSSHNVYGVLPPDYTNNQAELVALREALKLASKLKENGHEVSIMGDSQLAINLYKGVFRTHKPHLKSIVDDCRAFQGHSVDWLPGPANPADKWAKHAKTI